MAIPLYVLFVIVTTMWLAAAWGDLPEDDG